MDLIVALIAVGDGSLPANVWYCTRQPVPIRLLMSAVIGWPKNGLHATPPLWIAPRSVPDLLGIDLLSDPVSVTVQVATIASLFLHTPTEMFAFCWSDLPES